MITLSILGGSIIIGISYYFFKQFKISKHQNNQPEICFPIEPKPEPELTPAEAQAYIERLENVIKTNQHRKDSLDDVLSISRRNYHITNAKSKVQHTFSNARSHAVNKINDEVGNQFYVDAVKSPIFGAAKERLNRNAKDTQRRLINTNDLNSRVKTVIKNQQKIIKNEVEVKIKDLDGIDFSNELSPSTIYYMEKLQKNHTKWQKITGGDEQFGKLISVNDGLPIGVGIYSIVWGMGFHYVLEEFGLDVAVDYLMYSVMPSIAISPIGEIAHEIIMDFLIEEVGENAATEILEFIVGAATGIGLVLVGWKLFRYGRLAKRLFIDKEPLQDIRSKILENIISALEVLEVKGNGLIEDNLIEYFSKVEQALEKIKGKLQEVIDNAHKQRNWAMQYC